MAEVKFDAAEANAAYLALLPKHKAAAKKSMAESKALGFSMVETAAKAEAIGGSICADWPSIKSNLLWGINLLDWVLPEDVIGSMMAFVEWVDSTVMAKMCKAVGGVSTKEPAPAEPDPMHRGPQGGGKN